MQAAIASANAQWKRQITTINNANQMAVNEFNAREINNMNIRDYNNLYQTYRDVAARIWTTAENNEDRANQLSAAQLAVFPDVTPKCAYCVFAARCPRLT